MAKFAKLIELGNEEQVLLTNIYNSDNDMYEVHVRTDLETCVAQIKFSYVSEDEASKMLNNYSLKQANEFRSEMEKMFC